MSPDSNAMLALQCPSCGGKTVFTPGSDRFVCPYCGNEQVFRVPTVVTARYDRDIPAERKRLPRPRPREVIVQQRNQSLQLSWRWFSMKYIPMLFFLHRLGCFPVFLV